MQLKTLFEDEDAVSPVIGVILMVAITVILAAVIGTFVLGLGEQVGSAQPTTTFNFDYDDSATTAPHSLDDGTPDGVLTITHNGGNDVRESELTAKDGDGGSVNIFGTGSADVTTGDSDNVAVDSNDTVRVVWTASGGGDSAPLGVWDGPDA